MHVEAGEDHEQDHEDKDRPYHAHAEVGNAWLLVLNDNADDDRHEDADERREDVEEGNGNLSLWYRVIENLLAHREQPQRHHHCNAHKSREFYNWGFRKHG